MSFKLLEIAIGLVFIYLLLSLFATTIMEFIATFCRMRASLLKDSIRGMLDANKTDNKAVDKFYSLPLTQFLGDKVNAFWGIKINKSMPSYIHATDFYRNLLLTIGNATPLNINTISTEINASTILSSETKEHLNNLLLHANGNITIFQQEVEKWFDETMERANSWYKRKVQYILLIIGFCIAFLFNGDTIKIVENLNNNPKQRAEILAMAEKYVQENNAIPTKDTTNTETIKNIATIKDTISKSYLNVLNQSDDLLGWEKDEGKIFGFTKILGMLLTAFALSLGAQFWFDMLKKLINIRGLGKSTNV